MLGQSVFIVGYDPEPDCPVVSDAPVAGGVGAGAFVSGIVGVAALVGLPDALPAAGASGGVGIDGVGVLIPDGTLGVSCGIPTEGMSGASGVVSPAAGVAGIVGDVIPPVPASGAGVPVAGADGSGVAAGGVTDPPTGVVAGGVPVAEGTGGTGGVVDPCGVVGVVDAVFCVSSCIVSSLKVSSSQFD